MIRTITLIRRADSFWANNFTESVRNYKKELFEEKAKLDAFWMRYLPIDENFVKEIKSEIERELEYCNFYEHYLKEQQKKNFDKWMFKTKDDLIEQAKKDGMDSWRIGQIGGDEYRRDNGKITIRIIVEDKISSIRVSLHVNNSGELKFYPSDHGEKELIYSTMFKKESVDKRVEEYKDKADELFEEYLYPRYCYEHQAMIVLDKLFHVTEAE